MNPWLGDLVDERVRDLRAAGARARVGRRDRNRVGAGTCTPGVPRRTGRRPALVVRAARALVGHPLRPA